MAWTTPKTYTAGNTLTAAELNTYQRDNMNETAPAVATAAGNLIVTDGANSITERTPDVDYVATAQATSSTSYADLTTTGPSLSATVGGYAYLVAHATVTNTVAGAEIRISPEITGATSSTARDARSAAYTPATTAEVFTLHGSWIVTLTSGSNTFALKYKCSTGTATFSDRFINAIPF